MKTEEKFLYMMIQALRLLAADFENQIKALPDYVCIPDEVALTFGDAFLLLDQIREANLVSEQQSAAIEEIDDYLDVIQSKTDTDNPWTLEAMKTSCDWQHLRVLARKALVLLGESPDAKPDLGYITYVPGKSD